MSKRPARTPRLDLNPSSADRWTTCTASPQFVMDNHNKIPASTDTVYNMAGTTAHEVAAAFLQNREPLAANCKSEIDSDMLMHGWNYHEYVLGLREPGSTMLVEQKLPLWYMPARNCIVDAAVINKNNLHIVDYKYGEGVVVHPERSLQATIYAQTIGAGMLPFPPDDFSVFVHIYQPRGRAGETGPAHVWETTWGEIAEIAGDINHKAALIQSKHAAPATPLSGDWKNEIPKNELVFAPSDKACQWCPAKGFCTARQASLVEGFEIVESTQPLPTAATIPLEKVRTLLTYKAQMVSFLNDVEQWAEDFLKSGGKIPGFKLVMSRGGNRYWSDPKKAADLLVSETVLKRNEVVEEKTIGPAAAEKLLGKGRFSAELSALIAKPSGSPVLAPEEDKREALMDVANEFEVLP